MAESEYKRRYEAMLALMRRAKAAWYRDEYEDGEAIADVLSEVDHFVEFEDLEDELFPASACEESVFELVDETNDEAYYTLGLFRTLKEATEAITNWFAEYGSPPVYEDLDDSVDLAVRELKFGLSTKHSRVLVRSFRRNWDAGKDGGPEWTEIAVPNRTTA